MAEGDDDVPVVRVAVDERRARAEYHDCFMCYGTGKVAKGTRGTTCENCHGRGTVTCHECKGSGNKKGGYGLVVRRAGDRVRLITRKWL